MQLVFRLCAYVEFDVSEPRVWIGRAQRGVDEVHDARDCLAGAAVRDDAGPALATRMKRPELWPRFVAEG